MKIPNKTKAKNLSINHIDFKLFCAETYLEDIPTFVPLDIYPQQKVIAEMIMECFLFYAVSALDITFQEINKKLNLEIKQNLVRPFTIIKALKNNQTKESKTILDQILKYFQQPIHTEKLISDKEFNDGLTRYDDNIVGFFTEYENRNTIKYQHSWNRDSSRLWELRNQRNIITHESLLRNAGSMGTVEPKNYLRVRLVYNDNPTQTWDSAHYENPKEYYTEELNYVKKFINDVRTVLNKLEKN
jgi:hypothetical protein